MRAYTARPAERHSQHRGGRASGLESTHRPRASAHTQPMSTTGSPLAVAAGGHHHGGFRPLQHHGAGIRRPCGPAASHERPRGDSSSASPSRNCKLSVVGRAVCPSKFCLEDLTFCFENLIPGSMQIVMQLIAKLKARPAVAGLCPLRLPCRGRRRAGVTAAGKKMKCQGKLCDVMMGVIGT